MDTMVFVSEEARAIFLKTLPYAGKTAVLYSTNETAQIRQAAAEPIELEPEKLRWCCVGRLIPIKGIDRLLRIQKRLRSAGKNTHLYLLGVGALEGKLRKLSEELEIADSVTFLGYQTNPYKYVANCDLFVCASHAEGFSTAATEALIVGTPVCTVEVAGMKEMLGENNEYGIVTENNEDALCEGIRRLLDDPALLAHCKHQAKLRGEFFSTEQTVKAVEEMLLNL
jgi:glycosyltransferase involved in cell wall biosynthesis